MFYLYQEGIEEVMVVMLVQIGSPSSAKGKSSYLLVHAVSLGLSGQ